MRARITKYSTHPALSSRQIGDSGCACQRPLGELMLLFGLLLVTTQHAVVALAAARRLVHRETECKNPERENHVDWAEAVVEVRSRVP